MRRTLVKLNLFVRKMSCLLGVIVFFTSKIAIADFTLLYSGDWKVLANGFIEFDSITDSTKSFTEAIGNAPVARPNTVNGEGGRTQFSVRDTRFGFTIVPPQFNEWKTKAAIEFDLLGTDPTIGSASGTPEAGFYNNPTVRLRLAYMAAEKNGWEFLAGQYWAMFGWQPYYFIPSIQVPSVPAMSFSRTAQARVTKSMDVGKETVVQAALGIMRPPQDAAELPNLEGGFRIALNSRKSGFTGGATGGQNLQPMSLGVSGTVRQFVIPQNTTNPTGDVTHYPGEAIAVDFLIPVLASPDNKDVGNTLTVGGEFTTGKGYGDEFAGWTGNLANPLNSSKNLPQSNVNLDGGIGDFNSAGSFQLVDLTTFNAYFQYHLPSPTRTWVSGGYGWLYSDNINQLTVNGLTSAGLVPYDKEQMGFVNISRNLTNQIRGGAEYAHVITTYGDGTLASDNRYQVSFWFIF
jgi:hypothetical protein